MAFFLAGVLAALPALASERTPRWRLALAGCLWVLAIGSRAVLALPTGAGVVLVARSLYRQNDSTIAFLADLLGLMIPLAIGAGLLGWYNYDRFGDPFELGYRYQLSWREGSMESVFDPRYVLPNAYNYLANGFSRLSVFPYIKPAWGVKSLPVPFVEVQPSGYITEKVSGSVITAPAHIFALFFAWWLICGSERRAVKAGREIPPALPDAEMEPIKAFGASLLVLALAGFLPIALYYWAANRFLMDFVPVMTIISVMGAWVAVDKYSGGSGCLDRIS
jgi:hypothetical protein